MVFYLQKIKRAYFASVFYQNQCFTDGSLSLKAQMSSFRISILPKPVFYWCFPIFKRSNGLILHQYFVKTGVLLMVYLLQKIKRAYFASVFWRYRCFTDGLPSSKIKWAHFASVFCQNQCFTDGSLSLKAQTSSFCISILPKLVFYWWFFVT